MNKPGRKFGHKVSQETREKIRKANLAHPINYWLGKKMSDEHRKNLSIAHKGQVIKNHFTWKGKKQKPRTVEQLKAMSKRMIGRFMGEKHPRWKGGYENALWYNRQRRIIKKGNGGSHTLEEWTNLKKKFDNMCLCCKRYEPEIKLTVDHIIPISKGGSDDISNIQPLCKSCNCRKYAKNIDYISQYYKVNEKTI